MRFFEDKIFVDFEASSLKTTGCHEQLSFPIEAGWASLDQGELKTGSVLIKPHHSWNTEKAWDPAAEKVHGISLDELSQSGLPCSEAWDVFHNATQDRQIIVGHGNKDGFWLERFRDPEREFSPLDDYFIGAVDFWSVIEKFPIEVYDKFMLEYEHGPVKHRAEADATQLLEMYQFLLSVHLEITGECDGPARHSL